MVVSSRMIHSACIADIFHAKLTFWIAALFCKFSCRNRLWIFFWFGQVDSNIQSAIFCVSGPFHILTYTISADIIRILAQFVVIICSRFRRSLIFIPELLDHFTRSWHKTVHQFCIKKISVYHTVFLQKSFFCCIIKKYLKDLFQIFSIVSCKFPMILRFFVFIHF